MSRVCLLPLSDDNKEAYVKMAINYSKDINSYLDFPSAINPIAITTFANCCLNGTSPFEIDLIYPVCVNILDCVPIGFIIHSKNVVRSSKYFAYFIDEFYISPKYRSKGYGKAAAQKYVFNINQGNVGLFVLQNNKKAAGFWQKVFCDIGYPLESQLADDKELDMEKAYLFSTLVY